MNGDEWVTTTEEVPADMLRRFGLVSGSEEIRVRTMKNGKRRAYWTMYVSGYSTAFGHGGSCLTVRWQPVRDWGSDGSPIIEAADFDGVVERLQEVWQRSDLSVPTYGGSE